MKYTLIFLFCSVLSFEVSAQHPKVQESDIAYRKYIVRLIDLKKTENQVLFGSENAIVEILLQAVSEGKIIPYKSDKFDESLSSDAFIERISFPLEGIEKIEDEDVGVVEEPVYYLPSQLYLVELGEEVIFDKRRSVFVNQTTSLTLFIPEEMSYRGIMEPIATFKYEDCHNLFKADPRAISFDPLGNGRNINFSEIFLLRMYTSHIIKIGAPGKLYFDQIYTDPLQAFMACQNEENKIREYIYRAYNPK